MKKFLFYGLAIIGIAILTMVNVNLSNSNDNSTNLLLKKNHEALTRESDDNQFIYKIDHQTCIFEVSSTGHVNAIYRLFGINANVGGSANLTHFTSLYTPGGSYRLKDDVTCADVFDKILAAI
jgi:hypothetical protein